LAGYALPRRTSRPTSSSYSPECGEGAFSEVAFRWSQKLIKRWRDEASLPDKLTHPWFYDAKECAQQHKRDEAAYPKGTPWRYNDITAATNED
jgi:hypothetical protein